MLLSALRNSDLDGDGQADHVLCADLQPGCKGWALLAAVYASLAQTHGTQQGIWFNATDLSPAVGGPAMQAALQTYAALAASNAAPFTPGGAVVSLSNVSVSTEELLRGGGGELPTDGSAPACGAVNPLFAAGRCLFTIDWATAVLRLTQSETQGLNMSGRVGAAPLPGSTLTASSSTSTATELQPQLQPCTSLRCPNASAADSAQLATAEELLQRLQAGAARPPLAAAPTQQPAPQPQPVQPQPAQSLLVNRAPLLGEAALAWAVEPRQAAASYLRTEDFVRLAAFELDLKAGALLAVARAGVAGAGGSGSGNSSAATGPLVSSLTSAEAAAAALSMSASEAAQLLDLHPADLEALAQAVDKSMNHPNAAMDISLPFSSQYRAVLDDLAVSVLLLVANTTATGAAAAVAAANASGVPEQQVAALTAVAAARIVAIVTAFPYPAILLRLYWQATGFTPPSRAGDSGGTGSEGDSGSSQSAALRIGLPVAVAVGGALLLVLTGVVCYAFVVRRQASKRALFRAVKPPGAGPATTLVMTDVQNSTLLWEVLDGHVMDECLSLHHRIMREAIAANRGYEVCTEGDAFCVAFHTPDFALGFALHVQEHLLRADWPAELLEQPDGCEMWVRRCAPQVPALSSLTRAQTGAAGVGMMGPGALPVLLEGAAEGPTTDGTNTPTRGQTEGGSTSDGGSTPAAGAHQPSRLRGAAPSAAGATRNVVRGPSPLRQASSTTGIGTQDLDPAPTAAAAPKPATLSAALLDTSGPLQASPTEDAAAAEAQVPVPQAAAPAAGSQEPPQAPEGGQRGDEGKGPGDYSPEAVVPLRPGALVVEEEEGSDEDGGHGGQDERPSGRSSRPSAPSRALRPTPRPSATGLLAPGSPEGELILPVRPPPPIEDGSLPAPPPHPRPSGSGAAVGPRPPRSSRRMLPPATAARLSENGFAPQPPPALPQPAALEAPAAVVSSLQPELPELRQELSSLLAQGQGPAAPAGAADFASDPASAMVAAAPAGASHLLFGRLSNSGVAGTVTIAAVVTSTGRRPSQSGSGGSGGGAQAAPETAPVMRGNGALAIGSALPRPLPLPMSAAGSRPASGGNMPRLHLPGSGGGGLAHQRHQHLTLMALTGGGSQGSNSAHPPGVAVDDEDDDEDEEEEEEEDTTRGDWRKHINWNAEDATPPPLVSSLGSAFGAGYDQLASPGGGGTLLVPDPAAAHSPQMHPHTAAARHLAALVGGGGGHTDGGGAAPLRATFDGSTGAWAPLSAQAGPMGDGEMLLGGPHTKPFAAATLGRFRASLPRLFHSNASLPARQGLPQLDFSNGGTAAGTGGAAATAGAGAGAALRQTANTSPVFGSSGGGRAPLKSRPPPMLHLATSLPAPGSALPTPGAPPPSRAASRTPASALAAAGPASGAGHALTATAGRRGTTHRLSMAVYRNHASAGPFQSPSSSATGHHRLNPSASMAVYGYGGGGTPYALTGPQYAISPPASVTSEAPIPTPQTASGAGPRRGSLPRFVTSLANSLRRSKGALRGATMATASSVAGAAASETSLVSSPPSGIPFPTHPLLTSSGKPRQSYGDNPNRQDPSNHQVSRAGSGANAAAPLMVSVAPLYAGPDDPVAGDAAISPGGLALGSVSPLASPHGGPGGGRRPARPSLMGGAAGASPLDALWRDLNSVNSLSRWTDADEAGGGSGVAAWLASAACTIGGVLASLYASVPPEEVAPQLRRRLTSEGVSPTAGEQRPSSPALLAKALGGRGVIGGTTASAGSAQMAAVTGLPTPTGGGGGFSGYGGYGAGGGGGGGGGGGAGGPQQQGEPVLAFRGLRVRVGLHSGVRAAEVVSKALAADGGVGVADFTGDVVAICKEVSDAAMGGMVVLSGSAFRALQLLSRKSRAPEAMLLHLGEHVIKPPAQGLEDRPSRSGAQPDPQPATRELYAAVFPALACRLALLPSPVRTHSELVPGCLSAPAGLVAPVFCNVVGVEALLAWEALVQERLMRAAAVASAVNLAACRPLGGAGEVASLETAVGGVGMVREALDLFGDMAQEAASRHGGYVVASSADGGHWVLVFGCAEAAVGWGLDMLQAMLTAEWPDGFLEHELTEEAWEGGVLIERGLRLRIGVDYGRAMVRLVPRSGRLDYVGRPMNRAARIAAKAKAASVLMSGAAWSAARPALGSGVAATNLGTMQLKGVKEQLELWEVRTCGTGDAEHYVE
ncbi:hypothetical protein CHLRE_07g356550v5 [Chlamydomonas reinhardtii]|uniref:Guanylate cyclase domain-containing protein n=1 Tax=Chlamydomonas reinhardtii TaxID=3055 RepID=A0A2K3DLP7_CHLRE|nr:uncharacterized protein CHLRE_07g356550v5 [Chlamydomonas reinhardtii]PNW81448.1 hypothetical protein CHLRE_07g356550v5 [Chlamydomonas reinhardtii]